MGPKQLRAEISAEPPGIILDVHPRDPMNSNLPPERRMAAYLGTGLSALRSINLALLAANAPSPRRILDLPCGYGRIMRVLKAAFPAAALTGCELRPDALEFCERTFGAKVIPGDLDPESIPLPEASADLIWCGSLLTHVDKGEWVKFLRVFERTLAPGGISVFTTLGRLIVERRLRQGEGSLCEPGELPRVLADYDGDGFAFSRLSNLQFRSAYGNTFVSPAWVCSTLADVTPSLTLLSYTEGGWGGRNAWAQDVVVCAKPSTPQPPENLRHL